MTTLDVLRQAPSRASTVREFASRYPRTCFEFRGTELVHKVSGVTLRKMWSIVVGALGRENPASAGEMREWPLPYRER